MYIEVSELLNNLNYSIKDKKLLETALTHSSFINEHNNKEYTSNERLEYLGDAVLDLVIAEYFFNSNVALKEGELSKLRSEVVNEHSLAIIANDLSLGDFIKFGKGEIKSGGKNRESILADALEALIGAIYLDSDLETTREIILNIFSNIIVNAEEKKSFTNFKSKLQEYTQKDGASEIQYKIYKEEGPDNAKVFYSVVIINKKPIGYGAGKTKKQSEQLAARDALDKLGEANV